MRDHKKPIFLLFVALAIVVATTMAALRGQDQNQSSREDQQKIKETESQFPIADSTAPEPSDPVKRAKRRAKGEKYDSALSPIDDKADTIFSTLDWEAGLSALPVSKSDAIVIGRVLDAQAYLSNDKTKVYSEFTISIEQILKNDRFASLNPNNPIVVEREGGRVRYPSGHITFYHVHGQGMPRVGHRYVLFLTHDDPEQDFSILTGYELSAGRVVLLDSPGDHQITKQNGKDEAAFLNELRAAIANPQ